MTARLIPQMHLSTVPDLGMRDVLRALVHQLPGDAAVVHDHACCARAAAELLIVHPLHGIVALAVGPAAELETARRAPEDWLEGGQPADIPWHACALATDSDATAARLGRDDVPVLVRALTERLPETKAEPAALGEAVARLAARWDRFHPFWVPPEDRSTPSLELTPEQGEILERLADELRCTVIGPAGSGKTMLAVAHAQRCARARRRTLFLCEGALLAEHVRSRVPCQDLDVADVRGLFTRIARETGAVLDAPLAPHREVQRFWADVAPDIVERALAAWPRRYDSVVVDEGEAFAWTWWPAVERLAAGWRLGRLALFRDPVEPPGGAPLMLPETALTLELPVGLRCRSPGLRALAARLDGSEAPRDAGATQGLEIRSCPASPERAARAEEALRDLLAEQGGDPSRVAIVGSRPRGHSCLRGRRQLADVPLVDDPEAWNRNDGVLYLDVASMRGLEAHTVLLLDVDRFTPAFARRDLRTACTRARDRMIVLVADGEVADLLRT